MSRARVSAAVLAVALSTAACGAPETPKVPQTPVQDALNTLGLRCGEAVMVISGGGPRTPLGPLDARAVPAARHLVGLARRDPQAVYLSSPMSSVLATQAQATTSCELHRTASILGAGVKSLR
jgi:hypothetical protein